MKKYQINETYYDGRENNEDICSVAQFRECYPIYSAIVGKIDGFKEITIKLDWKDVLISLIEEEQSSEDEKISSIALENDDKILEN